MMNNKIHVRKLFDVLLLSVVTAIIACSNDSVAGGASSETTNANIVFTVASVNDPEGKEYEYSLVPADLNPNRYDAEVLKGITDDKGRGEIELPDTGEWTIEIIDSSIGYHKLFDVEPKQINDLGTISLGTFSILRGNVDPDDAVDFNDTVYLAGSPYSTTVDGEGKFSFTDIPPGNWLVVATTVDEPTLATLYESEDINLFQVNEPGGNYDRQLIQEVLDKTSDGSKTVDDVVTFETVNGKEVATIVDLSRLSIDTSDLDGTGIPRMSRVNLIELDMSNNGLPAVSAQWGWAWDQIVRLDLSDNAISRIPESFRDMRTLRYIDLRNNNLIKLPKDIVSLTPDTLYVAGNNLDEDSLSSVVVEWLDTFADDPDWRLSQR